MEERWFHIMWSTYGAWLHGDPRGFRDRFHRIHSSGDYKNPPPAGEHAGLHRYMSGIMHKDRVVLDASCRAFALDAILDKVSRLGLLVICASVSATHVHLLARLAHDTIPDVVGKLKRHSSHALRNVIPGQIWGARREAKPIRDRAHQLNAFNYILDHAGKEGAAVWRVGRTTGLEDSSRASGLEDSSRA
jgi:REP element-mobilizing transposase RayT